MAEDIKSPQFPESIFEGTLSNWLKKTGDAIKQDEVLAEIETDKVVIEVTAASDGVMGEIMVSEGETIESSQLIGNYTKGATTAKEVFLEAAIAENEFIIPHTVPNKPINGATDPIEAKNVIPLSNLPISLVIATLIPLSIL